VLTANGIIDNRGADWIRTDIDEHARGMSEDDFRAACEANSPAQRARAR
jgi:hypothetical protein